MGLYTPVSNSGILKQWTECKKYFIFSKVPTDILKQWTECNKYFIFSKVPTDIGKVKNASICIAKILNALLNQIFGGKLTF